MNLTSYILFIFLLSAPRMSYADEIRTVEETEDFRMEMEQVNVEKLKVYGNIATVLISVLFGTLGVAFVNSSFQKRQLDQQASINKAQIELQKKKAEADRQQAEMKYLGEFINFALEDDYKKRLRFTEYFAELTISEDLRLKWKEYHTKLKDTVIESQRLEAKQVAALTDGDSEEVDKVEGQLALLRQSLDRLEKKFGESIQVGPLSIEEVLDENNKRYISVSDGTNKKKFSIFRKGVFTTGNQSPLAFFKDHEANLHSFGIKGSAFNVMMPVAENAGNLDAVNTWDNAFLSFGMFQWAVGTGNSSGELAALLQRIKSIEPELFEQYYGQHGLEVDEANTKFGYLSLNGERLDSTDAKEELRLPEWAYRFWLSGQDPIIQAIEVQHAFSRLDSFYFNDSNKVGDLYISELVSSEYGVALILDNHLNRPAYVNTCLSRALEQTGLNNPEGWGTEEERKLIDAYLKIRATYGSSPMTDAGKRAAVTKKYLDNDTISGERDSFNYSVPTNK